MRSGSDEDSQTGSRHFERLKINSENEDSQQGASNDLHTPIKTNLQGSSYCGNHLESTPINRHGVVYHNGLQAGGRARGAGARNRSQSSIQVECAKRALAGKYKVNFIVTLHIIQQILLLYDMVY